jgi:hypothetical protein
MELMQEIKILQEINVLDFKRLLFCVFCKFLALSERRILKEQYNQHGDAMLQNIETCKITLKPFKLQ